MTNTENKLPVVNQDPDKPGSLALTVMNEMKDDVFKKPLPVTGTKRKHEILDEETYLDEIGRIIQRDFFPDLEKLKAQNAYLDAIENNDVIKLREIYSKYSVARQQPADACLSPATFETPVMRKIESSDIASKSKDKTEDTITEGGDISKNQGKEQRLDEFLKTHTSEDNESFEELVKETEIRQRAKHPWLYKDEITPALPAPEELLQIKDKPLNVDSWAYKNKNYIMYVPDGVEFSEEEKLEMFKKKKEINYGATRLAECPFNEEQNKETIQSIAQSQVRSLEGKIGVDGKELSLSDTPFVDGYGFVKTPSPMPGVNESPLMTWGQIEGTPFRLDGSDTPIRPGLPGPVFKIAEPPVREKLAHALVEKVGEKNRDKKQKALETARRQLAMASPHLTSSPFERFDSVSPRTPKLSSSYLKNRINTDQSLWATYSPRDALSSSRTPVLKSKPTTPVRDSESCIYEPSTSNLNSQNLTDNLLNLNLKKRPTAADFFS